MNGTFVQERAFRDILRSKSIVVIGAMETEITKEAAERIMKERKGLKISCGSLGW